MKTKTEITPAIIRAIKRAAIELGSQNELARKSGVNQQTLNMLTNGERKGVTRAIWDKLYPFVSPYLVDGSIVQNVQGDHNTSTINATSESAMIDKILKSDLTAVEKLKFIELVRK